MNPTTSRFTTMSPSLMTASGATVTRCNGFEKKRAITPPLAAAKHDLVLSEAWYRYYANAGTFRMHLWLHDGAKRANLAPVKQAINEITSAVHLKPNAHFGREKYQLKLMQWVFHPPKLMEDGELEDYLHLNKYQPIPNHGIPGRSVLVQTDMSDAVQGLSGLIMLGNAWESVDVFHALASALNADGRPTLGYFAACRVNELIGKGKGSLSPYAKCGKALKEQIGDFSPEDAEETLHQLAELYARLRTNAKAYQTERLAYMLPRLKAGAHPDTDPHFWDGWHEPVAASLEPILSAEQWHGL